MKAIIHERRCKELFQDRLSLATRVNIRVVTKKTVESIAAAGAFDLIGLRRTAVGNICMLKTE